MFELLLLTFGEIFVGAVLALVAAPPHLALLWLSTDLFPLLPVCAVDLFASDVARRRRHFDLRGVLLHAEFLSTAPQPVGAVCVADVVFDVDV